MQKEVIISGSYSPLNEIIKDLSPRKIFMVCDGSYGFLQIKSYFDTIGNVVRFSDFTPNPDYDSVKKAVALYKEKNCDCVVAVGGGSALDLAKCVKAYSSMKDDEEYIAQPIEENGVPFIAVPTTAGTGSEATRYAVIYLNGIKQSITHTSLIPQTVVFDSSALSTLPLYQKKSTLLDALCHSIESYWSINSTDESKVYAEKALRLILDNSNAYLSGDNSVNPEMFKAANLAGKAINITQTTAGHAMCYKLTSLYGIAHGHAAALCVRKLMPFMVGNTALCVDARGESYLKKTFGELAAIMRCKDADELGERFEEIFSSLDLKTPPHKEEDILLLTESVNTVRLKNNPVALDAESIERLYREILA